MDALIYLGKVNLYWVIFYICYRLFLHRHTFFIWNRAYLLSSLILAIALPAIHLPENAPIVISSVAYAVTALPVYVNIPLQESSSFPWEQVIVAIVALGAVFVLARLLRVFRDLFKVIEQGEAFVFDDHTLVLLPHNETGSFSFLKWLVMSKNDYENNLDVILRHELTHIKQMHSYDILLIEFLKILCWFNPVLWLYKHSIQEVHEFLADETAPNRERYATFLVSYGLEVPIQSLTNHFFNSSLLKNRIAMIYKTRTPNWLLGKYAMIIPVILIVVLSTASNPRLNFIKKAKKVKTHIPKISEVQTEKEPALVHENKTKNPVVNETPDIKGVITDKFGKPISKASLLANTTLLGKTDQNGKFLIRNIDTNNPIFISHVSYDPQQLEVEKSQTDYKVVLTRKKTMLNEIVVMGYAGNEVTPTTKSTDLEYSVEKMPEFPWGQKEMYKYLGKNVHYPTKAARAKIQGSVYITFTVDENGSILNPKVVKGLGYGTDEEAIRVVLNMPKWIPAEQNGEKVSMDYNLPVKFALNN